MTSHDALMLERDLTLALSQREAAAPQPGEALVRQIGRAHV